MATEDAGKVSPGGREIFTGESSIPQRGRSGHHFYAQRNLLKYHQVPFKRLFCIQTAPFGSLRYLNNLLRKRKPKRKIPILFPDNIPVIIHNNKPVKKEMFPPFTLRHLYFRTGSPQYGQDTESKILN